MPITIRKLRDAFIRQEWRYCGPSPYDTDETGYMVSEVEEWCVETFGKVPIVYYDDPYGNDYDQFGSGWMIWFRSEADAIAFKMRWHDYGR